MSTETLKTPLYALHQEWGGKMVEFAGYSMPVSYAGAGGMAEHHHTRESASLFDVSHMGQIIVPAAGAAALSSLVPADIGAIPVGASKYTLLMHEGGGVIDDCIISNDGDRGFYIVLNASRKAVDIPLIRAALPSDSPLTELDTHALIALQGPKAVEIVAIAAPAVAALSFMRGQWCQIAGADCRVARCGYTGEDGVEIAIPMAAVDTVIQSLMRSDTVKPAGLGARDSLRLEAGLCLYGNELNESTSPIEAGLLWSIPKSRRTGEGYLGGDTIRRHIEEGPPRKLVGLLPEGRTPVRSGAPLSIDGQPVGEVTSGLHSPTLGVPIALGYVESPHAGQPVTATVRDKPILCQPSALPFVPHRYQR